MVLDSFRVTEFRSVQDSGWIDAERSEERRVGKEC